LPAVLAAAAIALGVIGVGSMMTTGGAEPSPENAAALGAVAPTGSSAPEPIVAAVAAEAPPPAEAPAQAAYEASEGAMAEVPLQALLRVSPHYSWFIRDKDTDGAFAVPTDLGTWSVRAGLRWGGREPLLVSDRAVELSLWYEGLFRVNPNEYGFNGDRTLNERSHLFWGRALVAYSFTNSHQTFELSATAGAAVDADRFSAFRVGGALPLAGEFPLTVPGYFFQEFSARRFAVLSGTHLVGVPPVENWSLMFNGSVAALDHLPGLDFDRDWIAGVGGGIVYRSPSGTWQIAGAYGHGLQAKRSTGRGANAVSLLVQADMERTSEQVQRVWQRIGPPTLQGLQGLFRR
jgi:hypothetical protein